MVIFERDAIKWKQNLESAHVIKVKTIMIL